MNFGTKSASFVKLYEVYEDEEYVHLVMENCHGGSIEKIFTSS